MRADRVDLKTLRMQAALAELQALIQQAYPAATFAVLLEKTLRGRMCWPRWTSMIPRRWSTRISTGC